MSEISYNKQNENIECIHYKDWNKTYPPHTHTRHLTVGYIEDGKMCMVLNGRKKIYNKGDRFQIPPDIVHQIMPVDNQTYSMVVLCIKVKEIFFDANCESKNKNTYKELSIRLKELRDTILENPENLYLIDEMAKDSNISPFYMIRQFKKAFGLTPHQFQIQCKVRKAQKLLEEQSVSETTYDAGFCDQSHLDKSFQKLVGLTPKEYKKVLKD